MNKTSALSFLTAIPSPLLLDGGYSKFGHQFFMATQAGLITIDFQVYDPILGPIEYSEAEYIEITEIAKGCGSIADNTDLAPDEQLFLFNNALPGIKYWAFQPYDNAPLEAFTFSSDKSVVEKKFLDEYSSSDIKPWESMDEPALVKWAKKITRFLHLHISPI